MRRLLVALAVLVVVLTPAAALAQAAPACQFILGFAALHSLDPTDVGSCVDNQAFAANGDAIQRTTNGLLAWRKIDNWTAFTNGYWTWINGPTGLAKRLNTQRFAWEANPEEYPLLQPNGTVLQPLVPAVPRAFSPLPASVGSTVDWTESLGSGTFHAIVRAAYLSPVLPQTYYSFGGIADKAYYAPTGSLFAVFVLTVTNTGQVTGTVYDNDLDVRDAQGRTFTADQTPDGAFIAIKDRLGVHGAADSLGPSLSGAFALVYVVAPDATNLRLVPDTAGGTQTPAAPTAICNDGSDSYSTHASGTCSGHGGVQTWVNHP